MPQPGSGSCYRYLLGAVTIGTRNKLDDQTIHDVILNTLINPGPRTSRGIIEALTKVRAESGINQVRVKQSQLIRHPIKASSRVFAYALSNCPIEPDEAISRSPMQIPPDPIEQSKLVLSTLFTPSDLLYIGARDHGDIRPAHEWLQAPSAWGEYIIPNPLDGELKTLASGKQSRRADANVVRWRYAVAEFDNKPINRQLSIFLNIRLPIVALTYSGGKSVHAWIFVDAPRDQFDSVRNLYTSCIIPLGGDPYCRNPARLSRMPGMYRNDKKTYQQLLWINDPKAVEESWTQKTS